ncbi:hypothetical protein ACFVS2_21585 [Brevibacillus sp. NPDC058079]|uniref:hypothetical protein n=1 Tax=Brevibacillus sp. NPDC058079 TaxID=3346330 RepID=UPI0036E362D7
MFFSDLDRTLIYSKRFVEGIDTPLVLVEEKDGREISYMTPASYISLQEMRSLTTFVPVTARKWEEAMRISFIKNDPPEILVCEAGRSIFRNGRRDVFWDAHIYHLMEANQEDRKEAMERFFVEMKALGYPAWSINEYMVMTKVDGWTKDQKERVSDMYSWFYERGCLLLIQGRKVYLIPQGISKASAIRYLIQLYNPLITVSSGDAEMDASMFAVTSDGIAPLHHTISLLPKCSITQQSGIYASEEIIAYAKKKLCV